MEKLLQWIVVGSLALALVSCWQRDQFPEEMQIQPTLSRAPLQTRSTLSPFDVQLNDVNYRLEPLFDYELHGLVVSYQHHDGDRMLHERWDDHLNVADLCVVWGSNARDLNLNAFEFYNGQFTCFFRTGDSLAWQQFDPHAISNNHLLTDDALLRDRIEQVRVGDQIRLRGQLTNYSHAGGFQRGTSTTRTDEGNGACETIYVRDFVVLERMQNPWRIAHSVSWWLLVGSALFWGFGVARGDFAHRATD